MELTALDISIIIAFFALSLGIGFWSARSSNKNASEFFLSGRNMPWWLLGVSMVATTFAADTPTLVTDIVRKSGVAGNWAWWAFLLTGMLTVFLYAKLWRRSKVFTDLEFYELRYSGKPAAWLRGFRAVYLGLFFNIMIMATVSLAAIKISSVTLGLSPIQTVVWASLVTVIYSSVGGFKGVLITDFIQFFIALSGAFATAYFALDHPQVGGLDGLLNSISVQEKIPFFPDFSNPDEYIPLLVLPLAVQWWSVWYPGAEPGGGGYIAQRMLSAKSEKQATLAVLFFNVAHYALRLWPWIITALASIIIFPNLESIAQAYPAIDSSFINDDLAYPAMLSFLPAGLLGLVLTSLIAAYMSTLSSHLNWGASYLVHDFYVRFLNPKASQKKQILIGQLSTVILMALSACLALFLESALQAFNILLSVGAGTGLIFILRWFWWRINAYTEIAGMVASFILAIFFQLIYPKLAAQGALPELGNGIAMLWSVGLTTIVWLATTFLTQPTSVETLSAFYEKVKPYPWGWRPFAKKSFSSSTISEKGDNLPKDILMMVISCISVYTLLFAVGFALYGQHTSAFLCAGIGIVSGGWIVKSLISQPSNG